MPQAGVPTPIHVDFLIFDGENPRLASLRSESSQEVLLKILWEEMAVDEVAMSIAHNGFFNHEPLFVMPADLKVAAGNYVVVEGNRRLAAVKLLRDSALRDKLGATDLPQLTNDDVKKLDTLPTLVYPDRESIWSYTGFRHVHGVKPWDSYSKAAYVAIVHEKYGHPLEKIAERIGDTHDTVERLYRGYKVLEQAESQNLFNREDRFKNRFAFSHLYTALSDSVFQRYLGIEDASAIKTNPVPKGLYPQLSQLLLWLYGNRLKNIEPVVRKQQPDLWRLQVILSRPKAESALRSGYSLEVAYEIGLGDARRLKDSLVTAKEELQRARGSSIAYRGEDELYQILSDIIELVNSMKKEMDEKRSERSAR
jgi:hypothetical protein